MGAVPHMRFAAACHKLRSLWGPDVCLDLGTVRSLRRRAPSWAVRHAHLPMRAALLLGLVPLCSGALLELKGSAEDPAVIEMDGLALTKTSVGLEVGGSLVTSSYNVDEELGRLREENAALAAQVGLLNETLRALSLHVFSLPPAPPTSPPPITPPPPSPPVYPPSSPDMCGRSLERGSGRSAAARAPPTSPPAPLPSLTPSSASPLARRSQRDPPPPSPRPRRAVAACINEGGFVTDVKDWASIDARYNSGYK